MYYHKKLGVAKLNPWVTRAQKKDHFFKIFPILISLLIQSISAHSASILSEFGKTIWGTPYPANLKFYPYGMHFHTSTGNNKQLFFALNLHGYVGGTFVNSFNQQVYFIGVERRVIENKHFYLSYTIDLLHGYKENAKKLGSWPIGHDPGLGFSLSANLLLSKHLTMDFTTYGAGALWGVSYIF